MIVAGFVLLADATIALVPAALADQPPPAHKPAAPSPAGSGPYLALAEATSPPPEVFSVTYDPNAYATPTLEPTPTPMPTPRPKPTAAPTPRDTVWNARIWLKATIGATQYSCAYQLWYKESKWNPYATNGGGSYGIPQANPGSKMAAFGSNWRYSPLTQVRWGLWYVDSRYGSACNAWDFWQANGWY
jgi:hypothetical protein